MVKHMSQEQLRQYGERRLPAAELFMVAGHLAECQLCYGNFSAAFPALTDAGASFSPAWSDEPAKLPHLNYEEHFQPYVDDEIGPVEREIVESHVEVCAVCAKHLRELGEFQEIVAYRRQTRAARQTTPQNWRSRLAAWRGRWRLLHPVLVAVCLALAALGGVLLAWLWRQREPAQTNQVVTALPTISPTPDAPPTQATPELATNPPAVATPSLVKKPEPPPDEAEQLLAAENAPPEYRALLEQALRRQQIATPPELRGQVIVPHRTERGAGKAGHFLNGPLGTFVRETRPVLRWQAQAGTRYIVRVYDGEKVIAESGEMTANAWQPPTPLARGRLYAWEVEARQDGAASVVANDDGRLAARFKTLTAQSLANIEHAEQTTPPASLTRGLVYAQAGLRAEAEAALSAWQRQHPASPLAKRLLDQFRRADF